MPCDGKRLAIFCEILSAHLIRLFIFGPCSVGTRSTGIITHSLKTCCVFQMHFRTNNEAPTLHPTQSPQLNTHSPTPTDNIQDI